MKLEQKISLLGIVVGIFMVASPIIVVTEKSVWVAIVGYMLVIGSTVIYAISQKQFGSGSDNI